MADAAPTSSPPVSVLPTPLWWRVAIFAGVVALGGGMFALNEYLDGQGYMIELQARSAVGIVCLLGLAACFSVNLRLVRWRTIFFGIVLQLLLGWLVLQFQVFGLDWVGIPDGYRPVYALFEAVGTAVNKFIEFTADGAVFVFGVLAKPDEVERIFGKDKGTIVAFSVLPTIVFISSFFTILYFLGVLQFIVRLMAKLMMYLMGTSGAETLSGCANVFMGQTEAPLIVKPFIPKMTQSELLAMMVGGMATISGSLMAVYISFGADRVGILATSVMAAPCALYLSKLILPETETPVTTGTARIVTEETHANVIDAAASGAADGMRLAINVAAMLIAFLALLAMIDYLLGQIVTGRSLFATLWTEGAAWAVLSLLALGIGFWLLCQVVNWILAASGRPQLQRWFGTRSPEQKAANIALLVGFFVVFVLALNAALPHLPSPLQLKHIFAFVFSPLSFLMGVRDEDIGQVANLLGTKIAANEFVAFLELKFRYVAEMDHRSVVLATYALTGFANVGSVGIQIGGIGAMAPERRSDLARLGMTALLVGFLVTIINAAVAGMMSDLAQ